MFEHDIIYFIFFSYSKQEFAQLKQFKLCIL